MLPASCMVHYLGAAHYHFPKNAMNFNNKVITILLYFAWLTSAINSLFTVLLLLPFYCNLLVWLAWREMKGRDCGRRPLWFVAVTHNTEQQRLALRQTLHTDSTRNSSVNLCMAEAVGDQVLVSVFLWKPMANWKIIKTQTVSKITPH